MKNWANFSLDCGVFNMHIVVVNNSTFTSTEYTNAKALTWDATNEKYVITKSNDTTVSYDKDSVIIGILP